MNDEPVPNDPKRQTPGRTSSHTDAPSIIPLEVLTQIQAVNEVTGDHVLFLSTSGVIMWASASVSHDFGIPLDDLLGGHFVDFIAIDDRAVLGVSVRDAIPGLRVRLHFDFVDKRGNLIPAHGSIVGAEAGGVIVAFHEPRHTHSPVNADEVISPTPDGAKASVIPAAPARNRSSASRLLDHLARDPAPMEPSDYRRWKWIARTLAVFVVVIPGIALLAWLSGLHVTLQISGSHPSFTPLAALACLLCGVAIFSATFPSHRARTLSRLSAGGSALVGMLMFVGSLLVIAGVSESAFVSDSLRSQLSALDGYQLMPQAPVAALLTLGGIAAFGLTQSGRRWELTASFVQIAGWFTVLFSATEYLYEHNLMGDSVAPRLMSVPALLVGLLMLLALGAVSPDELPLSHPWVARGHGVLPIMAAVLILIPALASAYRVLLNVTSERNVGFVETCATGISMLILVLLLLLTETRRHRLGQETEDRLRRQGRQYRLYTDNMSDALLYVRNGQVQWSSRSVKELLGWDADAEHPVSLIDRIYPADREAVTATLDSVVVGSPKAVTARVLRNAEADSFNDYLWTHQAVSVYEKDDGETDGLIVVVRDISEQVDAEQTAHAAASALDFRTKHDALTGMLNRTEAMLIIEREGATASPQRPLTILSCDLDNFKTVNDGISHAAGNLALKQVADRFDEVVPLSGNPARIGGDEFLVILPNTSREEAEDIAESLIASIRVDPFLIEEYKIHLGISAGVVTVDAPTEASVLASRADAALQAAKANNRGGFAVYTDDLQRDVATRLKIAERLRESLEQNAFAAWSMPVVNMETGAVEEVESLARWILPDGSVVPAYEWVDVATDYGLMTDIGFAVIKDAIRRAPFLPEGTSIAVNANGKQLMHPEFLSFILTQLEQSGLPPERLIIEVTESTLIDSLSVRTIKSVLEEIATIGMPIHLDDFGTGYSSLTHLAEFPVTGIKLDRSFVTGMQHVDGPKFNFARGIASLAMSLGLTRIAEGVETQAQADLLIAAGWNHGQGWLFGKPAPMPEAHPESGGTI